MRSALDLRKQRAVRVQGVRDMVGLVTRRDLVALPLGLALTEPRRVELLMRVADGVIVTGDGDLARNWLLPPGSTCKPFTMQALLKGQRLKAGEAFLCPGELRVGSHNLACSHPRGLPPMDVAQAIAYSCNCATAHFAQRLAPDELASALRSYGFLVDKCDIRLMALGEECVRITPASLANAYRRLAGAAEPAVRLGLEEAVQFGTAQLAQVGDLQMAGKTGTAVTNTGLHAALFAGFAPSRAPKYVAIVVVQGRSGGADAAPLAAALFRRAGGESYLIRYDGKLVRLGVEEYVAAVLAGEASVFRQAEALKAMAVAARTFAAHQRGRHRNEGFDFCSTTHCQHALPGAPSAGLLQAAQATAGEVLREHDAPAFTPYSMCCGGTTESAGAVWPDVNERYLRVERDGFCPPAVWTCELTPSNVKRALHEQQLDCPESLQRLRVLTRTASGRARQIRLEGNRDVLVSAGAFRFAMGRELGWNTVRSNWFDASITPAGALQINGRGEGHGVGLCQRGAEAMAARGFGYRDILAFYYPNISSSQWTRMGGEGVTVYATNSGEARSLLTEAEELVRRLPWPLDEPVNIYLYLTVGEFRNATHEPGWIAARTEGKRIDLQPIDVLQSRGILQSTLRHELLHVAVESRAVAGLPVWFREGLVEWLAGERGYAAMNNVADASLRQRSDRRQAAAAYEEARAKVADLIAHYGTATVLGWVSRGLPVEVKNSTASMPMTKSR